MSCNQSYIYSNLEDQSEMLVKQIVDKILSSGKMSRQDHTLLTSTVFNKRDVREGERRQINRVFNYIQTGQLKLVNW
ncbi:hypothetical protein [Nostoc sp. UHCC 0870]|uniref:hypothetical protein n=1 Tax=Nostoc sp. UHCC 0870 TaxID=2914041 RepID=UPI001EE065CA|nr:hypothetical protein [Nostoc sp. UHCC 0870]UKO99783.1 hypothetical protein L6494_08780 [Nostoc sp. UHCC 0870]